MHPLRVQPLRARSPWLLLAFTVTTLACQGAIDPPPPGAAAMSGATGGAGNAATSGANSAAGNCSQAMLAPRRLWRLTPEQYDSTVRDLLGAQSEFGAGFPADSVFKGFRNNAESLLVTPLLADKL